MYFGELSRLKLAGTTIGGIMSNIVHKIQILIRMIGHGDFRLIFKEFSRRFYSNDYSYCLSRNLETDFAPRKARIPIKVRRLTEKDIPLILRQNGSPISAETLKERSQRQLIHDAGIKQCYVAVDENDQPCYMQWLIGPDENQKVQSLFKGGFPVLDKKECLLEGAYTHEAFRGKGIMPEAMSKIA